MHNEATDNTTAFLLAGQFNCAQKMAKSKKIYVFYSQPTDDNFSRSTDEN